jgi:2-keto-4-pentenoate hydratase/2-oxohepta-3-ene-1,7-dioic acid hydratase in catechol pathway
MKIICVGRNYAAHIQELKNEKPDSPVVFLKPETALVKNNDPVFHPEFTNDLHHEVEIILRISKEGKYIQPELANNYYDSIGLGIDFTARDLQSKLKEKGLPWEISKAFNQSAPVSGFFPKENFRNLENIEFKLDVNQKERQHGNTGLMLFNFTEILCYASQFFTLKVGDIIFTGTPAGVQKVEIGDHLEGYLAGNKVLDFFIK